MSKKQRTAQDEARELYEHRHDEDEWEDEPEPVEVHPSRTSVLSIRLHREELDALEQAAAQKGENLSKYVRKAITYRMQGSGFRFATALNRSIGYPASETQTEDKVVWSEPTRATSTPGQVHVTPNR
jgi:predicted DNA binding CopG/RHH family protein